MFLGLTMEKVLVIAVLAAFILGPERLPRYAAMLGRLAVRGRELVRAAKERARAEVGPEFDDVDWRSLDPRRYDPRRIVRAALAEDSPPNRPGVDDSATQG